MLRLIALAFMPTVSVTFGVLVIAILVVPSATTDFSTGAWLIYGAAALSVALALPVAWLIARRMVSRRERVVLDAKAGNAAALRAGPGAPGLPPAR